LDAIKDRSVGGAVRSVIDRILAAPAATSSPAAPAPQTAK
jgi:hypothetical protein